MFIPGRSDLGNLLALSAEALEKKFRKTCLDAKTNGTADPQRFVLMWDILYQPQIYSVSGISQFSTLCRQNADIQTHNEIYKHQKVQ